jgi:hypothetical protein
MSHLNSRVARIVAGLAVASAFAVVPMAAQAADTDATGTLSAGLLTNTAPAITPFAATLTGLAQTKNTPVGTWGVTDARGNNAGYRVTVSASAPTVDAGVIEASTLKLYTTSAQAVDGNLNTPPVAAVAQQLDVIADGITGLTDASTIQTADAGTGQGPWSFAEDAGLASGLEVVLPGTATPGAYSSTLTYTTAEPIT